MKPKDNRGFSLLELVIAVVILGIVVAPLLHTFLTSANTTARSQNMGQVTSCALAIAERIEAEHLDTFLENPARTLRASTATFYSYDTDTEIFTPLAEDELPLLPREDSYHIGVTGLTGDYVAMLNLQAEPPKNNVPLSTYTPMDALFAEPVPNTEESWEAQARAKFDLHISGLDGTLKNMIRQRTITLDIRQDSDSEAKIWVDVTYQYVYHYTYRIVIDEEEQVLSGVFQTKLKAALLPEGFTPTDADPVPAIYLLYYPSYVNTQSMEDKIDINNSHNLKCPIFLIKQKNTDIDDLRAKESAYFADIRLRQTCDYDQGAQVQSNAATNLESGTAIHNVKFRVHRSNHVAKRVDFAQALVRQLTKNRFYTLTVSIYPTDTTDFSAEPLYTLNATKLQ